MIAGEGVEPKAKCIHCTSVRVPFLFSATKTVVGASPVLWHIIHRWVEERFCRSFGIFVNFDHLILIQGRRGRVHPDAFSLWSKNCGIVILHLNDRCQLCITRC